MKRYYLNNFNTNLSCDNEDEVTIDFQIFLLEIKRKWWKIFLFILFFAVIVFTYSKSTLQIIYESKAKLYVKEYFQTNEESNLKVESLDWTNYYLIMMTNDDLMNTIAQALGNGYTADYIRSHLNITNNEPHIIEIISTSEKPEIAQKMLNLLQKNFFLQEDKIIDSDNVIILSKTVNSAPVRSHNILLQTILGVVLGGILACIYILIKLIFDKKLKNKKEAESYLNIPVLIAVPAQQDSNTKELFRRLLIKIIFNSLHKAVHILNVVGTTEKDCIFDVAINLAKAAAAYYNKALFIECDFKDSVQNTNFKTLDVNNLSNDLLGIEGEDFKKELYTISLANWELGSKGTLSKNSFIKIINQCKDKFDFIVCACSPYDETVDSIPISNCCEGTVFVVSAKDTDRHSAKRSVLELEQSGAIMLGTILNKVSY